MKKHFCVLFLLTLALQGCGNYIQVNRTVSKVVVLPFQIDQTGKFQSTSTITGRDIVNLFDPDIFGTDRATKIERFDIKSVRISGDLNTQRNTASQVNVTATVSSGSTSVLLLNETKMIRLSDSSLALDLLGAATGGSVSLDNALATLNALGVKEIQDAINGYLKNINTKPLIVSLSGQTSSNQRMVGTITIKIDASITYSRCEEWIKFFPTGYNEC
jgi:hypothetical protein